MSAIGSVAVGDWTMIAAARSVSAARTESSTRRQGLWRGGRTAEWGLQIVKAKREGSVGVD